MDNCECFKCRKERGECFCFEFDLDQHPACPSHGRNPKRGTYEPCIEDATAHNHVETGKFAGYPRALCSICPPMTEEEDEQEMLKYLVYSNRVARENCTRRPSKSLWRWLYRNRISVTVSLLLATYLLIHWILR